MKILKHPSPKVLLASVVTVFVLNGFWIGIARQKQFKTGIVTLQLLPCSEKKSALSQNEYCLIEGIEYHCADLRPNFIVLSKEQLAPIANCLGGNESWNICLDGKFLCKRATVQSEPFLVNAPGKSLVDCLQLPEPLYVNQFCVFRGIPYYCTDLTPQFPAAGQTEIMAPSPLCLDPLESKIACKSDQFLCQSGDIAGGWKLHIHQHSKNSLGVNLHKMCVLLPFRDSCPRYNRAQSGERTRHLHRFMDHMRDFLNRAGHASYDFILIIQSNRGLFNKGALFNVGARVAEQRLCDYVALHDVDHLPIHPQNRYQWPERPIHLCTNTTDVECCVDFAGGAVLMQLGHFAAINGFSNKYYGWGGEDADLYYRVTRVFGAFDRLDPTIGLYEAAMHDKNDKTQNGSHSGNVKYLMQFRQSKGRLFVHSDGYHNHAEHASVINATAVGNLVTVNVEVLRDGVSMPPC